MSKYIFFSNTTIRSYRTLTISLIIFTLTLSSTSAQAISFNGRVVDAVTTLPINGATIYIRQIGKRIQSDIYGGFQFSISHSEQISIAIHHLAYNDLERNVDIDTASEEVVIFSMQPNVLEANEIIIRSNRIVSSPNNSPFPLNVELSNQLISRPTATISDAVKFSPGIYLVRDGSWETGISIRGMSRSNIVTLVDHTRIETANDIGGALSLFNIHDIERIEIVRSSGAALYGTGAFGGIVHCISKKPSFTEQLEVTADASEEYTSVNGGNSHFIGMNGATNDIALRLSGSYRNAANTKTPNGILLNSQFTDFSINGFISAQSAENQLLNISYQKVQGENTGIPGGSPFSATASAKYSLVRRELFGLEYSFSNVSSLFPSVVIRASHQNILRKVEVIQNPTVTLTPHAIHSTLSGQVETNIKLSPQQQLVIGTEIWQRELTSKRERIDKTNNKITGERPVPHSKFFSAGLYGQDEWKIISDELLLSFGARYDWISISNDKTMNPEYIITSGVYDLIPSSQKILWTANNIKNQSWSAHAGLNYAFTENVNMSLLASHSFRSPSLEERYQFLDLGSYVRLGNPDLQPEQCDSYNAGFDFHHGDFKIETDFFLNEFENLVTDISGTYETRSAFIKQNIGKAKIYGFECTNEIVVTNWSIIKYSLSYVRGEDMFSHTNLPQIAPFNGNVEMTAYVQQIGSISILSMFSLDHNNRAAGELRTARYAIIDISAVSSPIQIERLSIVLRFGIENVFDKSYQNHLSTIRGVIKSEPGRNYFLSTTISL